jgi:arsenite-transporting ATPase
MVRKMIESTLTELALKRKFLFFGGKGGVGKTTMAASTAMWLAERGCRTLVVATDPTVSLSTIFEQRISETQITPIDMVHNLCGLNINPRAAAGYYQARLEGMVANFIALFGNDVVSTPCAEEMAAFDQFVTFLNDREYEHVVFDTAPTGHTLRELSMPFDWSSYMSNQIKSRTELSALTDGGVKDDDLMESLGAEKKRYDTAVNALSNDSLSAFELVLLPEKLPIEETASAFENLAKFNIKVKALIINEVIPKEVLKGNWFLERRSSTQDRYLVEIERRFPSIMKKMVPLLESDAFGLENLKKVARVLYGD